MKRWLGRGRWWIVVLLSSLCVAQAYNAYRTITMSVPASDITIPENTVIQYHQLSWTKTGTVSTCTVALDSSTDGTTWSAGGIITGQTCTSNGNSAITAGSSNYVRITATALSGGGSVQFIYKGWVTNPSGSVALPVSVVNGGTGSASGFTSAGVIALFTGCSGTQYLGADGACHTSSSAVASVFGRTGAVVAASADYSVAQVTGAAPLASPTLTGTPAAPTPAASDNSTTIPTTAYVTTAIANAVAGVNPAVAVKAATAAILPNSPSYNNGVAGIGAFLTTATTNTALVVDGVTIGLNDRVLVKNQGSSFQNGVYFESQLQGIGLAWILTRALDYDTPSDMNNTGAIPVISGTVNTTTQWVQSSQVTTVGTDAVTFSQFSIAPTAAAVVGLFSGCSGTLYLGADGACHATSSTNIPQVGKKFCSATSNGAATNTTCASVTNVTTNDVVILFCYYFLSDAGASTVSVSDSLTNSWTQIKDFYSSTATQRLYAYWAKSSSTGADTFTCTSSSASAQFWDITAVSVVGASGTSPIDQAPAGTQGTSLLMTGTPFTTTSANDLGFMWAAGGNIGSNYHPVGGFSVYAESVQGNMAAAYPLGPTGSYALAMDKISGVAWSDITFAVH